MLRIISQKKLNELIDKAVEGKTSDLSQLYEREFLMKQANIGLLQSQINPHFLYNALECIRGQALLHKVPDIAEMAKAMSLFFRYNISTKGDIVTLRDELDSIVNYMTIQQFRFKNRLQYSFELPEDDTLDCVMPKLSLQPIVENAVVHGFLNKTDNAVLKIMVVRTEKHVSVVVSDNGAGMTFEELKAFADNLENDVFVTNENGSKHTGIGVRNVNKRFKLYFGEQYGISVNSLKDVGTNVELFFPYSLNVK